MKQFTLRIATVEMPEYSARAQPGHTATFRRDTRRVSKHSLPLTLVFAVAWFQPLIIHRTGIPVASILFALVGLRALVDHAASGAILPFLKMPAILGYLGLVWATVVATKESALTNLVVWATLLLAVILGPLIADNYRRVVRQALIVSAWFGLAAAIAAVAIERYVSVSLFGIITEPQNPLRSSALAPNPNAGAVYLMIGIVLVWGFRPRDQGATLRGLLRLMLIFGGVWALLATGSRGALLGLACAGVAGLYMHGGRIQIRRDSVRYKTLALLLLATCLALYQGLGPQIVRGYVNTQARLDSADGRVSIWREAITLISDHWLFGKSGFVAYGVDVNNAHNTILEAAIRYGLPGAALFLAMFVSFGVLFYSRRRLNEMAWVGLLLLIAAGVYSLTHTGILDNTYIWIVLGVLAFSAKQPDELVAQEGPSPPENGALTLNLQHARFGTPHRWPDRLAPREPSSTEV